MCEAWKYSYHSSDCGHRWSDYELKAPCPTNCGKWHRAFEAKHYSSSWRSPCPGCVRAERKRFLAMSERLAGEKGKELKRQIRSKTMDAHDLAAEDREMEKRQRQELRAGRIPEREQSSRCSMM
jgi:hypothetical protein